MSKLTINEFKQFLKSEGWHRISKSDTHEVWRHHSHLHNQYMDFKHKPLLLNINPQEKESAVEKNIEEFARILKITKKELINRILEQEEDAKKKFVFSIKDKQEEHNE